MEKVIKIATVLIIVTLLFLFLFNLRRWLRKKGYFNNNKVVDQETNNKVNKNIPSKIDDDNGDPGLNKVGYFWHFLQGLYTLIVKDIFVRSIVYILQVQSGLL